jgi:hypothetical protein
MYYKKRDLAAYASKTQYGFLGLNGPIPQRIGRWVSIRDGININRPSKFYKYFSKINRTSFWKTLGLSYPAIIQCVGVVFGQSH